MAHEEISSSSAMAAVFPLFTIFMSILSIVVHTSIVVLLNQSNHLFHVGILNHKLQFNIIFT